MKLVKYVRDEKGNPIGCVAAIDKNKLGYSICHTKDKFLKKLGRKIAIERAKKNKLIKEGYSYCVPFEVYEKHYPDKNFYDYIKSVYESTRNPGSYKSHFIAKELMNMKERADKYFKEENYG